MPVQVACPKCRRSLALADNVAAGQDVRCPLCDSVWKAPSAAESLQIGPEGTVVGPASPPDALAKNSQGTIGGYRLGRELGSGTFGIVYLAHDDKLGRELAIKVLNRQALADPEVVKRFRREAQVLAGMHHNNVVPIFQFDDHEGSPYIVSKFIPGQPLSKAIPEGGMDPGRATTLTIQLLEALSYAHEKVRHKDKHVVVLHRDVKPGNILLDEQDGLYLTDFGLAGWIGQDVSRMTQDGTVMGTPAYMSPEQVTGDITLMGPAADQYSAAVVLYELLTGSVPFAGQGNVMALFYNILNSAPPAPSTLRRGLDPRLESICLKGMAKDIKDRFASCAAFAEALRKWQKESSVPVLFVPVMDNKSPANSGPKAIPSSPHKSTIKSNTASDGTAVQRPSLPRHVSSKRQGKSGTSWLIAIFAILIFLVVGMSVYIFVAGPGTSAKSSSKVRQ